MTDGSMGELVVVVEETTDRYQMPQLRGANELEATRQARAALLVAKRTREPAAIAAACLTLVENLLERHRVLAASWTIEDVLETLDQIGDVPGAAEASWSLHLALAALYERLGDGVRARTTARMALTEALRADSEIGRARCRELLRRFAGKAPELRERRRSA